MPTAVLIQNSGLIGIAIELIDYEHFNERAASGSNDFEKTLYF